MLRTGVPTLSRRTARAGYPGARCRLAPAPFSIHRAAEHNVPAGYRLAGGRHWTEELRRTTRVPAMTSRAHMVLVEQSVRRHAAAPWWNSNAAEANLSSRTGSSSSRRCGGVRARRRHTEHKRSSTMRRIVSRDHWPHFSPWSDICSQAVPMRRTGPSTTGSTHEPVRLPSSPPAARHSV